MTVYLPGVDVRGAGADDEPPVCKKGRGLGRWFGVCVSCDGFLVNDGE